MLQIRLSKDDIECTVLALVRYQAWCLEDLVEHPSLLTAFAFETRIFAGINLPVVQVGGNSIDRCKHSLF